MLTQILMQGFAAGFPEQILEHQILAAAFGKAYAIFLAQRRDFGIAVLAIDPAGPVAMPAIETSLAPRHFLLPARMRLKALGHDADRA
jgi:hypothetical protein